MRLPRPGDWQPNARPALLGVQLLGTWQAALRGLDYLTREGKPTGALAVIESEVPAHVWGALFLASCAVVITGLAGRWPAAMTLGHALVAALYAGIGVPLVLHETEGPTVALAATALLGLGGAIVLASGQFRARVRLAVGIPSVVVSALGLNAVMGQDYRTATALVAAAGLHACLAYGVWVGAQRGRLADELDRGDE